MPRLCVSRRKCEGDAPALVANSRRARSELGWTPAAIVGRFDGIEPGVAVGWVLACKALDSRLGIGLVAGNAQGRALHRELPEEPHPALLCGQSAGGDQIVRAAVRAD